MNINELKGKTLSEIKKLIEKTDFYTLSNSKSFGLNSQNVSICLYKYDCFCNKIIKTFLLFFLNGKLSLITEKTF